ncbi:MAG: response regulator transcription factor [Bacteroidota bacterium]
MIVISIVEDELDFQEWIQEEIEEVEDIVCSGIFDKGEEALKEIPVINPDIVIMDLSLKKSKMDGIECMLRLNIVMPEIKFLVISSNDDESIIFEALKVGAGAYIDKGEITEKLIKIIYEFHKGGAPMSPGIARRVIQRFHKDKEDLEKLNKLTERQNKILSSLSEGFLLKEIADQLGIAEGTVKQHTHTIYKKLQVNNRTEAIRKYLN